MPPPQSPASDHTAQTPPNFLGYLNPEAVLREQVHSERGKTAPSPGPPPIGQWVEERDQRPTSTQTGPHTTRIVETGPHSSQESQISRALLTYLEAVGVDILPSRQNQTALLEIYFNYVHPLLPSVLAFTVALASGAENVHQTLQPAVGVERTLSLLALGGSLTVLGLPAYEHRRLRRLGWRWSDLRVPLHELPAAHPVHRLTRRPA